MDNERITQLRSQIKDKIKNNIEYSQREAIQLSLEMHKVAYEGETSEESFAYQRGANQGITAILNIIDEIIKESK